MGQWGETIKENDCEFVLHIKTNAFEPIEQHNIVDAVVFIDSKKTSLIVKEEIKNKYVGKKYGETI